MESRSIVEYLSEHERYSCGYCKSENTSYSHGLWGHCLTSLDYQDLIDRGWRRSGKYCYKPMLNRICCPQYPIRCEALKFKLSKSQKRVLKRMQKFLLHGQADCPLNEQEMESAEPEMSSFVQPSLEMKDIDITTMIKTAEAPDERMEDPGPVYNTPTSSQQSTSKAEAKPSKVGSNNVRDPDRPPCRKAKELRKERKLQKLINSGLTPEAASQKMQSQKQNIEKSLEDFLSLPSDSNPVHRLELRLVPCDQRNEIYVKTFDDSHRTYQKYQTVIHRDPLDKCSSKQFVRFLVSNPFQFSEQNPSRQPEFGSYHQQYWLDDKLIAVGVIDILPRCVSSVYLYYDPEYSFLSLGSYAALREIAFTRELNRTYPDLLYYYMGFYIHSCPKMKYKGSYSPSFLLCPETYGFHPIEKCVPKLEVSKYQRFEEDLTKTDQDGIVHINEVMILHQRQVMNYSIYRQLNRHADDEEAVKQYAELIGKKCYLRILLYRG